MAANDPPMSPPPESAAVVDAILRWEEKDKYTVYKVIVRSEGVQYVIYRRYNDFGSLHKEMRIAFPDQNIPKLPGKRVFGDNFDPAFITARKHGLHDYIQAIITHPVLAKSPIVIGFLLDGKLKVQELDYDLPDKKQNGVNRALSRGSNHIDLAGTESDTTTLEDFHLLKVIGKGSFGKVLLARHIKTSLVYAIKVLSKASIKKRNEVKHVMAERNVLVKNLKHPFLVGLHYSFQTPENLYFVLTYVNGGELFFHLQKEHKFSEPRTKFYGAEIVSAIEFMHKNDVVYRDLKPENILLDHTGHVVLTDFGLCKEEIKPGQTTGTFCGTPEYLAPEVLRKQPYGRGVDWWCLGAVLYEMLVGLPPFYSRDFQEMYHRILYDRLTFPPLVSENASSLLTQLLDRDVKKRLGAGPRDAEDVKNHVFFEGIEWDRLCRREYTPPFNPNVSGALDLKNIDPQFINEPVQDALDARHRMQ
eukprot:Ihof_evm2s629 gene=Ihof_evmTU2s629